MSYCLPLAREEEELDIFSQLLRVLEARLRFVDLCSLSKSLYSFVESKDIWCDNQYIFKVVFKQHFGTNYKTLTHHIISISSHSITLLYHSSAVSMNTKFILPYHLVLPTSFIEGNVWSRAFEVAIMLCFLCVIGHHIQKKPSIAIVLGGT